LVPGTSNDGFALSTVCLLGLTVHAGARILHDCLGWHLFMH